MYFETLASGATVSWQRLTRTQMVLNSNWHFYRKAAQALYHLRDGRPDRAYASLRPSKHYSNKIEQGLSQAWLATTARSLAEA